MESKAKEKSVSERQQLRDELSRPILIRIEALLMKYLLKKVSRFSLIKSTA